MQKNGPFEKHNAYGISLAKSLGLTLYITAEFRRSTQLALHLLLPVIKYFWWHWKIQLHGQKMLTLSGGDFMSIPSWSSLWMGTSGASSSSKRGPQIFGSCGCGRKCLHWNSNSYSRPPQFPSKCEARSCKQEQGGGRGVRWRPWRMATARLVLTSSQKPFAPPQRLW